MHFLVSVYHHDFTDIYVGMHPAPPEQLKLVHTTWVDAEPSPGGLQRALELLFTLFNVGPDFDSRVIAYRSDRLRSLSVGDVLVIHTPDGDMAFDCAVVGWEPRTAPLPEGSPCPPL